MLIWTILFLPLASFALIALFLRRHHCLAALISTGAALLGAILAWIAVQSGDTSPAAISWLQAGSLSISINPSWDPLAHLMILIVTCVGALIHVYSWGYMKEDPSRGRFFAYLSLFMFSMLGIVLAGNLVMMFMFWELVGLSSYLLIGFWYQRAEAADAGKKAFLVNKIGDFGFLLGIIMVWTTWGTVDFQALQGIIGDSVSAQTLTIIALLLFCGAVGKSAQFPLHVWLPDAMEGPTPVSALIHAATMVAAGVYMLCRIFFLLKLSADALVVISWIGGITALFAALWAIAQDDIKRILAYSTLSQLGYMVMAVGLASPHTAMLHLSTHACFKALLFLAAGSVIVALHHEQNIWRMGGLRSRLPVTFWTFLIGLAALCGLPFTAGAFSKDEILAIAFAHDRRLFALGLFTALLTAFYMGRLFFVAFLGKARSKSVEHAHENGWVMWVPLVVLALMSLGYVWHGPGLHEIFQTMAGIPEHPSAGFDLLLFGVPITGLAIAWLLYGRVEADPLVTHASFFRRVLASKFYFDEVYALFIRYVQDGLAGFLRFIEWILDFVLIRGILSLGVLFVGNGVRLFQTGNLQTYLLFLGLALVTFIYWAIIY